MDTLTAEVSLRVLDPSNKKNSRFFKLKSVPRFGNVLKLQQFILEHYGGDTLRRKILALNWVTSLEIITSTLRHSRHVGGRKH